MSDSISRADAIEAVCKAVCEDDVSIFPECDQIKYCDEIQALLALPSADAVDAEKKVIIENIRITTSDGDIFYFSDDAVHGEWVCKEREYNDCDGHYAHYWYECSVCGARPPKDTLKNEWHSNYCPSCGAKMKGGTDE